MPVRKIPKNYLFVTGAFSSRKSAEMIPFESLLEKDYLFLLEFDDSVSNIEGQPVRIPVPGVRNGYVPDFLSHFQPAKKKRPLRVPLLVEVKKSTDLKKNAEKYALKFATAAKYAEDNELEFQVLDETQIRSPRLSNLKFLRAYRNFHPHPEDVERVLEVAGRQQTSSLTILENLADSDESKLRWLPVIWSMVVTGKLITDMSQPFRGDVPLQVAEGA